MFSSTQLFICGIVILVIGYLVIYGSSSTEFREGLSSPGTCSSGTRTYSKVVCDKTHTSCSGYDEGCYAGYLIGVNDLGGDAATLQAAAKKDCDATPDCTHINTARGAGGYYQMWGGGRECTPDEYKMHAGSRLKPLWYSRIVTPMGIPGNLYKANDDRTCDPGCEPETTTTTVAPYGQYGKMHQTSGDSGGGGGAYAGGGDDGTTQCSTYKRSCWNAAGRFPTPMGGVVSAAPGGLAQYSQSSSVTNQTCHDSVPPPTCSTFLGANNCPSGTTSKSANAVCNSSAGPNQPRQYKMIAHNQSCNWARSARGSRGGSGEFGTEHGSLQDVQKLCDQTAGCDYVDYAYRGTTKRNHYGYGDLWATGKCPSSGWGENTARNIYQAVKIPTCDDDACCTPNPQCSSLKGCPDTTTLTSPSQVCAGPVCSTDECCPPNPVCTSSICNAQTQVFTGADVTCNEITCNAGECCADRAQCNSITCDLSKYDAQPADTYCAGTTCSIGECCIPDPTCAVYNCPIGTYHPKPNLAGIKCGVNQVCATDNCCDLNPTCAAFSSCPKGEHLKDTAASIHCKAAACTPTECCGLNPSCSTHTCPNDDFYHVYSQIPNASSVYCDTDVCTDKQCCVVGETGNLPKVQTYPLFPPVP